MEEKNSSHSRQIEIIAIVIKQHPLLLGTQILWTSMLAGVKLKLSYGISTWWPLVRDRHRNFQVREFQKKVSEFQVFQKVRVFLHFLEKSLTEILRLNPRNFTEGTKLK